MEELDIIIVLGGVIHQNEDGSFGANPKTSARPTAAASIFKQHPNIKFIISGGYNFGVRYSHDGALLLKADFDHFAFSRAQKIGPSEASVLGDIMIKLGVPSGSIYLEELSATTIENAKFCFAILSRSNFIRIKSNRMKIGILTNSDHIDRAMLIFSKEFSALNPDLIPIIAEDWLVQDTNSIDAS